MATPTGFPRGVRLLSPADFARVYAARQTAAGGPLVLHACPGAQEAQPARLGLSVSRRVGNAVVRNRWKRRLREAFRSVRPRLPAGNDFVIVVRPAEVPAGAAGAKLVEDLLVTLVGRVVARPAYTAAARRGAGGPTASGPAPRRRR